MWRPNADADGHSAPDPDADGHSAPDPDADSGETGSAEDRRLRSECCDEFWAPIP